MRSAVLYAFEFNKQRYIMKFTLSSDKISEGVSIAGAVSGSTFKDQEPALTGPALNKKSVDANEWFRRDRTYNGPDPMKGQLKIRMYYEPAKNQNEHGKLRFRPCGFGSTTGASERDLNDPAITPQTYVKAWHQIVESGFETEGLDPRFGSEACPINAIIDLDAPRSTSPETLPYVMSVADEWITYLKAPGRWHHQQGEETKPYLAIYLSSSGSGEWLGEVGIWRFSSCCPNNDLRGLDMQAADEIANDTYDHFSIKFILPADVMNQLALRIMGIAIGHPVDLRPECLHCHRGKQYRDELCDVCWNKRLEALHAGEPWPPPKPLGSPIGWSEPPF
jgi:hypothetical protein